MNGEVRQEGYRFFQDIIVPCYEVDSSHALRASSFMDMAQEIAYWAAQGLGFGYDDLQVHHTAWVLSRMHFRFSKAPQWRDRVTIATWHKGAEGLFYLRDFRLSSQDGEELAACTSSWLVIDTGTRRLVRPESLKEILGSEGLVKESAIAEPAPKVVAPKDAEPEYVFTRKVLYSDVDILGHTNNVRYMVWAMDALDYQMVTSRNVSDVEINFNKETLPGEEVALYRCPCGGDSWYVEGRVDGKNVFCVRITF